VSVPPGAKGRIVRCGCGPSVTTTISVLMGDRHEEKDIRVAMERTPACNHSWADDKEKTKESLKKCGTVLTEILISDDIPQDLLDKADCVVFFHRLRPRLGRR